MSQQVELTDADRYYIANYRFPERMDEDAMIDELAGIVDNYVSETRGRNLSHREQEQIVDAIFEAIMERYRREHPREEPEEIDQDFMRRLQERNAAAARARVEATFQRDDPEFQAIRAVVEAEEQIAEDLSQPPPTEAERATARAETARRMEAMKANRDRLAAAAAQAAAEEQTVFGECTLCLESINYGEEAVDAHDIEGEPSGHVYHKDCIMRICSNEEPKCPECRAPLLCSEIESGARNINTNLGLKGGKHIKRTRSSSNRRSKKRHVKKGKGKKVTRKGKGIKKYTNKKRRNRIVKKGRKTFRKI